MPRRITVREKTIVYCNRYLGEAAPWYGPAVTGSCVRWIEFEDRPASFWERKIRKPNLAMVRAALQTVLAARRTQAGLLLANDAAAAIWCGLFLVVSGTKTPCCAFTFNYPRLPRGVKRMVAGFGLRRLDEIFVHSSLERELYSRHFGVPLERFKLRLWANGRPASILDPPLHAKPYVCAIGGNGRDYKTLLDASRLIPHIPLVVVARPEQIEGIPVPSHVRLRVNVPSFEAWNTLAHSEFMVLPLKDSHTACGHVTLVSAMHLGKAVVATNSEGIADYVQPGKNGLVCDASSPAGMAAVIAELWNDPAKAAALGAANRAFGAAHCTDDIARSDLAALLKQFHLLDRE
jgi:hypothetical protein